MLRKPKNRYQAFAVHLLISAVIFVILALIIIYIWYPGFLFWSDGGLEGIRIIAGVDFIIGPILTLLVYRLGKPGLHKDLLLIGLVQFICLVIGTWLVYNERPLAIIYANGSFYTMSQNSFHFHDNDSKLALAQDDKVPAWVYVDLPKDTVSRSQILMKQLKDGPIHAQEKRYRPFQENLSHVFEEDIDLSTIEDKARDAMSTNGKLYYFNARYSTSYMEIDGESGAFIKLIPRANKEASGVSGTLIENSKQ